MLNLRYFYCISLDTAAVAAAAFVSVQFASVLCVPVEACCCCCYALESTTRDVNCLHVNYLVTKEQGCCIAARAGIAAGHLDDGQKRSFMGIPLVASIGSLVVYLSVQRGSLLESQCKYGCSELTNDKRVCLHHMCTCIRAHVDTHACAYTHALTLAMACVHDGMHSFNEVHHCLFWSQRYTRTCIQL